MSIRRSHRRTLAAAFCVLLIAYGPGPRRAEADYGDLIVSTIFDATNPPGLAPGSSGYTVSLKFFSGRTGAPGPNGGNFTPPMTGFEPQGIAVGPDGTIYVGNDRNNSIDRFSGSTGQYLGVFVQPGAGGLTFPKDLAFGSDGNLYVSQPVTSDVLRFDRSGNPLPSGSNPGAQFVSPSTNNTGNGGPSLIPGRMTFTPDGRLLLSEDGSIRSFGATTGAYLGVLASYNPGDPSHSVRLPGAMTVGPDGNLYVSDFTGNAVDVLDLQGHFLRNLGTVDGPGGLRFSPLDGLLYVTSNTDNSIVRYDPAAGKFETFVASGAAGLDSPTSFVFAVPEPSSFVLVALGASALACRAIRRTRSAPVNLPGPRPERP